MPKLLYNEEEILRMLKAGSQEAFTQLYEQYSHSLYLNLLKLVKLESTAEDILQDTFVKIWERRASLSIESNLGGYLFRVAQHNAHDSFRKLKRDQVLRDYILNVSVGEYDSLEKSLLDHEESPSLSNAIEHLPPQRRQVFQLCKLEGKSYKDVSSLLGISTSTINDHIVKAMRFIRDYMLADNRHVTSYLLIPVFLYCLKKILE